MTRFLKLQVLTTIEETSRHYKSQSGIWWYNAARFIGQSWKECHIHLKDHPEQAHWGDRRWDVSRDSWQSDKSPFLYCPGWWSCWCAWHWAVSLELWFVSHTGAIKEPFIKLLSCKDCVYGEALSALYISNQQEHGLDVNLLRGQGYDRAGAITVPSMEWLLESRSNLFSGTLCPLLLWQAQQRQCCPIQQRELLLCPRCTLHGTGRHCLCCKLCGTRWHFMLLWWTFAALRCRDNAWSSLANSFYCILFSLTFR